MAQSVRCDRAVDYEGSSFCSDVFQVSYNPRGSTFLAVEKASAFGLDLYHSEECRAPRALSILKNDSMIDAGQEG